MLHLRKTRELAVRHIAARLLAGANRNYSKDNDSSDDEKRKKKSELKYENVEKPLSSHESKDPEQESASAKLNRLLASMQTVDDQMNGVKHTDIVAKPGVGNKKKKLQHKEFVESKDIFVAAKNVASLLGDKNEQKTESELLTRLLGGESTTANATPEEQSVASNGGDISLSELLVGMKIDRRPQQNEPLHTRSEYVRRSLAGKKSYIPRANEKDDSFERNRAAEIYTGSVDLYGGEPLGIFTDGVVLKDSPDLLHTWSYLNEQALKTQVSHPPSNYFDKIAKWTEQGKVWRFPIDNEQDWLDEKDVDFSQHIFLEQHLEDWCPNRGPIRHFMELVCVGLSKNPYITAKEKKEHIMWYKNYFESKKDILKDLMSKNPKIDANVAEK